MKTKETHFYVCLASSSDEKFEKIRKQKAYFIMVVSFV